MRCTAAHLVAFTSLLCAWPASPQAAPGASANKPAAAEWHFIVSGDSRNCGDVIMPAIAASAAQYHPAFYWHLGDLRAIYEIDEDYAAELQPGGKLRPWDLNAYQPDAWTDFVNMQIKPFDDLQIPFVIGIGNHETIPPMSREKFLATFSKWLPSPENASAKPNAYYHWLKAGVDFIYLDNSTAEQFDRAQVEWLYARLDADRADPGVQAIVVGMHKSLPDSLSNFHSMSETPAGQQSGRCVYQKLEQIQREDKKRIVVLSSHSHFLMTGIYNTPFWREHGKTIVPGILVGTAGAVRYRLPKQAPAAHQNAAECTKSHQPFCPQTDVYGYLLATVNPKGHPGTIAFEFKEITPADIPAEVRSKFAPDTVQACFKGNKQMTPAEDTTQYLPFGACPY